MSSHSLLFVFHMAWDISGNKQSSMKFQTYDGGRGVWYPLGKVPPVSPLPKSTSQEVHLISIPFTCNHAGSTRGFMDQVVLTPRMLAQLLGLHRSERRGGMNLTPTLNPNPNPNSYP